MEKNGILVELINYYSIFGVILSLLILMEIIKLIKLLYGLMVT